MAIGNSNSSINYNINLNINYDGALNHIYNSNDNPSG